MGDGGSGEALQHRGAEIEVRLGRNGEKRAQWRCSPRKGSAMTLPHDSSRGRGFSGGWRWMRGRATGGGVRERLTWSS
jgi:hypothetical protein